MKIKALPPSSPHSYFIRNFRVVADVVGEAPVLPEASQAEEVVAYMKGAFDQFPEQEQMWVVLLNRRNKVLGRQLITVGTLTNTLASPRECYRSAIIGGAAAIVLVHNHPSGDPEPSSADIRMTRMMREAGITLDIHLLDHIIIGAPSLDPKGSGYYSFRHAGLV